MNYSRVRTRFVECPEETTDEDTDPCHGCDGFPRDGHNGGDPCFAVRVPDPNGDLKP